MSQKVKVTNQAMQTNHVLLGIGWNLVLPVRQRMLAKGGSKQVVNLPVIGIHLQKEERCVKILKNLFNDIKH